jgi:hypothetical protein
MNIKCIEDLAEHYSKGTQMLVDNLCAAIMELPQNHRINECSGSPRCFTMNFSDLGDNWTPFHHDFRAQYEFLIQVIRRTSLDQLTLKLRQIIEKGVYREKGSTYKFHPDVIHNLANMLGVEVEDDSKHKHEVVGN